ncbi:MAG: hypothetical protein OXG37_11875 [Actinomycetia bacterium]|nr:hypothetical protein [Actinomycetes bacterium]
MPDLFPTSFPGVVTSRDSFLVDIDQDRLRARIADYFNPDLGHEEIARRSPDAMKTTAQFDAQHVRGTLLERGGPDEDGFVRYANRPFDVRWLYWETETKLLDRPRPQLQAARARREQMDRSPRKRSPTGFLAWNTVP